MNQSLQYSRLLCGLAAVALATTSPAFADRYSYEEAAFENELIGQCILTGMYKSFGGKADISAIQPPEEDCKRAMLPCHHRHDLLLDPELDLSTLSNDAQHQLRHCLYQHIEEAEYLAFQQVSRRLAQPSEFKPRTIIRSWLKTTRERYKTCALRHTENDTNEVACTLNAVIEYAADVDTVIALRQRLEILESAQ